MTYSEKLKHPKWQEMRLRVMERDGFACRDCGTKDDTLHVHHCYYEKGDPWDTRPDCLLTLCAACHEKRQELEGDIKLMIGQIMAKTAREDLGGFAGTCAKFITSEGSTTPQLYDAFDFQSESDLRWFFYARYHPEFRPAYEAVTGNNPPWEDVDTQPKPDMALV